jgi:hypothetical protein
LLEAAWPMPLVVVVGMATRPAMLVRGLEVLKAVMVMLPVARSIPQPLLSMPQAVAPLEAPIFLKGKPVSSRWVHNSPVVISLS